MELVEQHHLRRALKVSLQCQNQDRFQDRLGACQAKVHRIHLVDDRLSIRHFQNPVEVRKSQFPGKPEQSRPETQMQAIGSRRQRQRQ
jgi:hypothetical protein